MGIIDTLQAFLNDTNEIMTLGGGTGGNGNFYKYLMGLHEGLIGYTPLNNSPNTVVGTAQTPTTGYVHFTLPISLIKTADRKKIKFTGKIGTTAGIASAHAPTFGSVTFTFTPNWSDDVYYDNKITSIESASATSHVDTIEQNGVLDFMATYQASDYISKAEIKHGSVRVWYEEKTGWNNKNLVGNHGNRSTGFNWIDLDNLPVASNTKYAITCSSAGLVQLTFVYTTGYRSDIDGGIIPNAPAPVYTSSPIENKLTPEAMKFGLKLPNTVSTRRAKKMQY